MGFVFGMGATCFEICDEKGLFGKGDEDCVFFFSYLFFSSSQVV